MLGRQPVARPLQSAAPLQQQPLLARRRQPLQQRQPQRRPRAEPPQHEQQPSSGSGPDGEQPLQGEHLSDSELEEGPVGRRERGVRRALQVGAAA